jgi:hypothetical protein
MLLFFLIAIFNCWVGPSGEDKTTCQQIHISSFIREKMNSIDPVDLPYMEDLFRHLFVEESFAFTLFGSKPMSIGGVFGGISCDERGSKIMQTLKVIEFLGWETWQKYAHLFPSKNFYFDAPNFKDNPDCGGYRIVNKKSCEDIIKNHLSTFQECIGKEKTIQDILENICSPSFFITCENKKKMTTCFGLLFGYGEKNSQACERRNVLLIQALYQAPYHLEGLNERMKNRQEYFHVGLQPKESIEGLEQPFSIQSVIEGLNELQRTYRPIALVEENYLCPIGDVRCAGMSEDPETKALQEQYQNIRQKLVDIYNAENFLELVLTQLSS